jgi:hypothetical protein
LPEKYQNYIWAGEFEYKKYEYLYKKGLINGGRYLPDVLKLIDESVDLSQDVLLNGSDLSPALKLDKW